MTKTVVIIPVRYDSSRLPGKPLLKIGSRSLLEHVYSRVKECTEIDRIIVATDDERIFIHAQHIGAEVEMTFRSHQSGTDRCAQVANQFWSDSIIINVQGDEPFVDPIMIDDLVRKMKEDDWISIGTCKTKIQDEASHSDVNTVKVLCASNGNALYFSRLPLPYQVDQEAAEIDRFKHIGIYAYRNKILQELTSLAPSMLEQAEHLEQLRWLEAGYKINVMETNYDGISIDTPADLEKANQIVQG